VTSVEVAGPGFINLRLSADALARRAADDPSRRRELRPLDAGGGRAGQRRICLGQPDRAAAHGPLPGRGRRRCAGARARGAGHRVTGILCQRRRRPGRVLARSATFATARRWARTSARSPRVCTRATISSRRRGAGGRVRRQVRRRSGERVARPVPQARGRGDARPDPARPGAARHPSRRVRLRSELQEAGKSPRRWRWLRGKGLVYEGTLERPKSLDEHDEWEPVELTLFRSTRFGDDQDRPMKKSDGSWTYFGSDARLSLAEGEKRRPSGQHLGRRPRRHGQADQAAVPR
jgi:hypothetical protein